MCDASGIALGAELGQWKYKLFHTIYYSIKTFNDAQCNYTVTKQELFVDIYAFEKFYAYLLGMKVVVHMNHTTVKYLMKNKEPKPHLIRWIFLLQ